ncbi:MAG: hypothetical protein U9N87_13620 [Planctomycetota bacterium]|nr:hypothetical protein [Planctomycetota bacterium]
MQFRRSGQRDSRRRRVLVDSSRGRSRRRASGGRSRTVVEPRQSENYGDALFMDEQTRLTDLVPRSLTKIFALFIVGVAMLAGLEALYAWMPKLASMTTDGRVAAFDLDGEGSLAVWFSSTTFLLAAAVAVIVYTVRRHKTDDYQGYYRVWLWAALCWLILSIDETSSLHEGFKEMMTQVSGTRLLGDGSMWWIIAYFLLLGAVGTRLVVDMRPCKLSTFSMVMVALCYSLAIVAQLEWILPEAGARAVMVEEGAEMLGNLFLLLAMTLHARYVVLDAEGLLPQREEDEAEEEDYEYEYEEEPAAEYEYDDEEIAAEEAALFGQTVRVHPPHSATRRASKRSKTKARTDAYSSGMESAESNVGRKLTKQEKKALRRRLEKERRRRSA